jgi:hypothetical protein
VPLLLLAFHFSDYSFPVHHPVNCDDQDLLARAMASDFSVAWQCFSKRTIGFLLRIKLYALVHLGVSPLRSFLTAFAGANPTTSEFTPTTPALYVVDPVERFLK